MIALDLVEIKPVYYPRDNTRRKAGEPRRVETVLG